MPAGLQVFRADGSVLVDLSTRMGLFLGEAATGVHNGTVSHPYFREYEPWSFLLPDYESNPNSHSYNLRWAPRVRFNGQLMLWEFTTPGDVRNIPATIVYGVY